MKLCKYCFLFLLLLILTDCSFQDQAGEGHPLRIEKQIYDGWKFCIDPRGEGELNEWQTGILYDSITDTISLPHSWSLTNETLANDETAWYFNRFEVPLSWEGQNVHLIFTGVIGDAKIWVNNTLVYEFDSPTFTLFKIDISEHIRFSSHNSLVVKVENRIMPWQADAREKGSKTGIGGILRPVLIQKTSDLSIDFLQVEAVPGFRGQGKVRIRAKLQESNSGSSGTVDVWYQIKAKNHSGQRIIGEGNLKVKPVKQAFEFSVELAEVLSWDMNHPNLYELKMALGSSMILTDSYTTSFGFRSVDTQMGSFILNGENVRLAGIDWPAGIFTEDETSETDSSHFKMLQFLRETNSKIIRFQWPPREPILDWCDNNGILVQVDIPIWSTGIDKLKPNHLGGIIQHLYNHPSVVSWGLKTDGEMMNSVIFSTLGSAKYALNKYDSSRVVDLVLNEDQTVAFKGIPVENISELGFDGFWFSIIDDDSDEKEIQGDLESMLFRYPAKVMFVSVKRNEKVVEVIDRPPDALAIIKFLHVGKDLKNLAGITYAGFHDLNSSSYDYLKQNNINYSADFTDIQGPRKEFFDALAQNLLPFDGVEAELWDGDLHVTAYVGRSIPSYPMEGYRIQISDHKKALEKMQDIPFALPGGRFNVVFDNILPGIISLKIYDSQGRILYDKMLNLDNV